MIHHVQMLGPLVVGAVLACSVQPSQDTSHASRAQASKVDTPIGQAVYGNTSRSVESVIPPPRGYERVAVAGTSFGAWLRQLPVRPGRPPVHLYDGRKKANQTAHHVVLDVDVGDKDLQQCADAVIRLRAEYLFAGPCRDTVQFRFTSGDVARWADWRDGVRPVVAGDSVSWHNSESPDDGYANFRDNLDVVFMYAGSASLEQELEFVADPTHPEIGDVFIVGGFPGHAVLVIDVAQNDSGDHVFLLAQSYMPAQDIHILKSSEDITPWYRARSEGVLRTPEWEFQYDDLKRFPHTDCKLVGGES